MKSKTLYLILTTLFTVLFCICKALTLGWLSILAFLPIWIYLIAYVVYGSNFACLGIKAKSDYLLFWLISFFFSLSGLFFTDAGDYGPPAQIIKLVPHNVSLNISLVSALIVIILMIVSRIIKKRHNLFN